MPTLIRKTAPHPKSACADLPLRPLPDSALTRPTKDDLAYYATHPITVEYNQPQEVVPCSEGHSHEWFRRRAGAWYETPLTRGDIAFECMHCDAIIYVSQAHLAKCPPIPPPYG